ncbi:hypothetical protein AAC387_Pa03g4231 [Persea americana]
MTSASELFYTRRSRIGRNPNLGFSPSPSPDRNLHHHFHRHHHNHPREEGCDPVPRRSSHGPPNARHLCHRVSQTERESVRFDLSTSPGTGNSSSGGTSSSRTNRPRLTTNDRLPGAVVQARARLFERLRGVSISENSRTNRGISWEEFAISDGFRIVDTGDWETEIPEWFVAGAPFTDVTVQGQPTPDSLRTSKKKPPGLSLEDINCLQRVVFNVVEGDGVSRAMRECCICLESFQKGDVLICLPCDHRYHPDCLDPWVKACGDCPYCRTAHVLSLSSNSASRRTTSSVTEK